MLFKCCLKKGLIPKIRMLYFFVINSILLSGYDLALYKYLIFIYYQYRLITCQLCELEYTEIQFNSIKKINHPTRGNFVVVMAGS